MHSLVLALFLHSGHATVPTGLPDASVRPMVPLASDSVQGLPPPGEAPIIRPISPPIASARAPRADDPPRDSIRWEPDVDESQGLHARLGILVFAHGVGVQLGGLLRKDWFAGGVDGWIRPWAWTREVRLSPGRRARVQELLYGVAPWISFEIPLGGPDGEGRRWTIAPFASMDLVAGSWYGTSRSPVGDIGPSLGVRLSPASPLGLGLRRSFGRTDLAGTWKGDLTCEF